MPIRRKELVLAVTIAWSVAMSAAFAQVAAETDRPGPAFSSAALQGDVRSASAALEAGPRALFERRYVAGEDDEYTSSDPLLGAVVPIYRSYWRRALMAPNARADLESELEARIQAELGLGEGADTLAALEEALRERGYGVITGRTPPLLELIVWQRTRSVDETVRLTDGAHVVPVNYMEDFASRGWAHFATFGRASAGGWANADGLNCVCADYDLDSEAFTVSFLRHEARHFADYGKFPKLEGADLEYRAKLTELVYAERSLGDLLTKFAGNARRIEGAPHSLANWHVIDDLAARLVAPAHRTDPEKANEILLKLPAGLVRRTARSLLDEHEARLHEAGALTTKGSLTARMAGYPSLASAASSLSRSALRSTSFSSVP